MKQKENLQEDWNDRDNITKKEINSHPSQSGVKGDDCASKDINKKLVNSSSKKTSSTSGKKENPSYRICYNNGSNTDAYDEEIK